MKRPFWMRPFAAGGIACLAGLLGLAQTALARPSTLEMTCRAAQRLVASRGAVVMTTGRGTYDRILASDVGCLLGEAPKSFFAPTRDHPQCHVGYICVNDERPLD